VLSVDGRNSKIQSPPAGALLSHRAQEWSAMHFDFLVIGAGVSGASAAFELAASGSVALIEAENAPGYHSTGRSAALYTRNYGVPIVQRINAASHGFFMNPPAVFVV